MHEKFDRALEIYGKRLDKRPIRKIDLPNTKKEKIYGVTNNQRSSTFYVLIGL